MTYGAAFSNMGSLTHWVRPGIKPSSSQIQCQILNPPSHNGNSGVSFLIRWCYNSLTSFSSPSVESRSQMAFPHVKSDLCWVIICNPCCKKHRHTELTGAGLPNAGTWRPSPSHGELMRLFQYPTFLNNVLADTDGEDTGYVHSSICPTCMHW